MTRVTLNNGRRMVFLEIVPLTQNFHLKSLLSPGLVAPTSDDAKYCG